MPDGRGPTKSYVTKMYHTVGLYLCSSGTSFAARALTLVVAKSLHGEVLPAELQTIQWQMAAAATKRCQITWWIGLTVSLCATRTGTNESPSRNRLILGPFGILESLCLGRKFVTHGAKSWRHESCRLACSQPAWKREHHRCREALLPPTTKLTRLASGMWNCP